MLNPFPPNRSHKRSAEESFSYNPRDIKKSKNDPINYELLTFEEKIKQAAINGDLHILKSFFENDPTLINMKCDSDYTALYYAAINWQFEVLDYLLDKGASIQLENQLNIIQILKEPKYKQMRQYIKDKRGFDKATLAVLTQKIKEILEKEYLEAKARNKNFLVIMGESHGNFKNYQIERQVLLLLSELGIKVLYNELPAGREAEFRNQSRDFCIKKLNMENISVDNHPLRDHGATIEERNEVMALEILKHNEHGVLITGAFHLQGLLENDLSKTYFHIVPFNLIYLDVLSSVSNDFLINCENVINVFEDRLTLSKPVIERWNENASVSVVDRRWLDITSALDKITNSNILGPIFAPSYTMLLNSFTTQPPVPAPAAQSEGKLHMS